VTDSPPDGRNPTDEEKKRLTSNDRFPNLKDGEWKITDIENAFGRYGWYVKNKGTRNSIFQTFCYLLSHCGI